MKSDAPSRGWLRTILFGIARLDPSHTLVLVVLTLLSFGLVMIYSSSAITTGRNVSAEFLYLQRQIVWLIIAIGAMIGISRVDYRFFEKYSTHIFIGTVSLLLLTLVPFVGTEYNGARRWLRFLGLGFQPSDLAKVSAVLLMSAFVVKKQQVIRDRRLGTIPAMALLASLTIPILMEPDLGTTLLIIVTSLVILVLGGIRMRHFLGMLLCGVPVVIVIAFLKFGHVKDRLSVWLNPEADIQGKGHQIYQSLVALGSGEITGVGLGGSFSKRFFLPEESTDFIFAIIGEEFGFIGTTLVLALFVLFAITGIRIALRSPTLYGSFVAFGITLMITLQALMNIAVVTATVPTKGISLPFISAGGSSLTFFLIGVGVLMSVARKGTAAMEAKVLRVPELAEDPDSPFVDDALLPVCASAADKDGEQVPPPVNTRLRPLPKDGVIPASVALCEDEPGTADVTVRKKELGALLTQLWTLEKASIPTYAKKAGGALKKAGKALAPAMKSTAVAIASGAKKLAPHVKTFAAKSFGAIKGLFQRPKMFPSESGRLS
ncbi:MAG: putative lipid II flippase FtsW [Planctomycetes bacterium]|nr:putative lipid II flippase FtsW [Planctomycetota bacterium]